MTHRAARAQAKRPPSQRPATAAAHVALLGCLGLIAALGIACGGDALNVAEPTKPSNAAGPGLAATRPSAPAPPANAPAAHRGFTLTSPAFAAGATIPKVHTGEGDDLSPPLIIAGVPAGARSLALILDDPDAPTRERPRPEGPWVHWVLWGLPPDTATLPEGLPRTGKFAPGTVPAPLARAQQGANSWPSDNLGYKGPMPPPGSGPHRYVFTLYALDAPLELAPGANKDLVLAAIDGHVLGTAVLIGRYERKR